MTLDQLRIFLAVAKTEHITQAAGVLNLTQSAVSASIAALEATHGVRLFDRVGRRIALTQAGRLFVGEAQAVLARAETARLVLSDWNRDTMGRIRIHASQTVASYWLPPRLVRMQEEHPKVEIALTVGNTSQVTRALLDGAADLGVVEGSVAQPELAACTVAEDEMALVIGARHPLVERRSISPDEYCALRWVLREAGSGTRAGFEAHLTRHGLSLKQLKVVLEFPSNESVLAAVIAGDGVSALSRRAVALAVAAGQAHALPIADMRRAFTVLLHNQRHHTRATMALMALLTRSQARKVKDRRLASERSDFRPSSMGSVPR